MNMHRLTSFDEFINESNLSKSIIGNKILGHGTCIDIVCINYNHVSHNTWTRNTSTPQKNCWALKTQSTNTYNAYVVVSENFGIDTIYDNKPEYDIVEVAHKTEDEFVEYIDSKNLVIKKTSKFDQLWFFVKNINDVDFKISGNWYKYNDFKNYQLPEDSYFRISYDNGYSHYSSHAINELEYRNLVDKKLHEHLRYSHNNNGVELLYDHDHLFYVDVIIGNNERYSEVSNS